MKLNKIFTIATLAASAIFATSCKDDVAEYAGPGQWDADANYANVYFPTTSLTEMVDPAAETKAQIAVVRRNSSGAVSVPMKVLEGAETFTVSNAEFAAGKDTAYVTVDYSKAEIGTTYKLVMALEGAQYVSSYSANNAFTYNVTRVKWNSLGEGKFADNYYFEQSWPVEILQRDDDKSYYRIMEPYPTDRDDRAPYVELHVMKKGDQIAGVTLQDANIIDWNRFNTGYINSNYPGDPIWVLPAKSFSSRTSWDYIKNCYVSGFMEDGKTPGQFTLGCYYYLFGVGGGWNALEEAAIVINLPGFVEEYTATIEDYEWEPMFSGEFTSAQLGTKKDGVTIYKGVPVDSIEAANPGCYDRFVEANGGTPYYIEAPYTKGYNLLFLVKNKNVSTLAEYELQETGMTALNQKVYANILASSQFTEDEINLDITFQNKGGDVEYGTTTETLANITWSPVGIGTFTYTMWWDGGQDEEGNYLPLIDPGYEVLQRDDNPSIYKVADWGAGVDYVFTWNKTTNVCATQLGAIGESHPSYGPVYVVDASTYSSRNYPYADYPSQYVPEENTFYFYNAYVVDAGSFGAGLETLTVEWDASAARAKAVKAPKAKKSVKKNFKVKVAKPLFSWNAKHVQPKSHFELKHGVAQKAEMLLAE